MDLRFTPEEIAFRDEVRTFFRAQISRPTSGARCVEGSKLAKDESSPGSASSTQRGWAVPHWPKEWGGTGWTPVQHYIFQEEMQLTPAPPPLPFGVNMVGPVIIAFGTEAQKKRFLPRIANLDDWWCQGFSEPGAGSDLASLQTAARARRRPLHRQRPEDLDDAGAVRRLDLLPGAHRPAGEEAGGHLLPADRHEDARHHACGRSSRSTAGTRSTRCSSTTCEVPAENLVGEENKGWDYAKFLLGHERTSIARVGVSKERIRRLKELAAMERAGDKPLIEDERFPREDSPRSRSS